MGNVAVLEARSLRKTYAGDGAPVEALRGVDLCVDAGEFVAIMGPSGCGKSTLLHLLGALDTPTSGEVLLDGVALHEMSDDERTLVRRRRAGFVFQAYNLVDVLTAAENVALPAVVDGRDATARAIELLDAFGIGERAHVLPSRLSGGEQQRVALARALMNEPALLLADEPTGNLDLRAGREIMAHIASLHADGQTVVVVTHDPSTAVYAQRVVLMRDGLLADEVRPAGPSDAALIAERVVRLGD